MVSQVEQSRNKAEQSRNKAKQGGTKSKPGRTKSNTRRTKLNAIRTHCELPHTVGAHNTADLRRFHQKSRTLINLLQAPAVEIVAVSGSLRLVGLTSDEVGALASGGTVAQLQPLLQVAAQVNEHTKVGVKSTH